MKEVLATYKSSLTLDLCQDANRLVFFMRKKSAKLTKSNGKCFRCFSVANRNDASALKIHIVKKKNRVRVLYTSKRARSPYARGGGFCDSNENSSSRDEKNQKFSEKIKICESGQWTDISLIDAVIVGITNRRKIDPSSLYYEERYNFRVYRVINPNCLLVNLNVK